MMGWVHSISLPLETGPEAVATVQELQRITCLGRSFAEVCAESVLVHFETLDDAISFMDTFMFLAESMAGDDDAAELLDECVGEIVT